MKLFPLKWNLQKKKFLRQLNNSNYPKVVIQLKALNVQQKQIGLIKVWLHGTMNEKAFLWLVDRG